MKGIDEVTTLQATMFLGALAWMFYAIHTFVMRADEFTQVSGFAAAAFFLYIARIAAPDKDLAWLYGWNEDVMSAGFWFRMPLYSTLFIGPAIRHGITETWGQLEGPRVFILTLAVSTVVGYCTTFYVQSLAARAEH